MLTYNRKKFLVRWMFMIINFPIYFLIYFLKLFVIVIQFPFMMLDEILLNPNQRGFASPEERANYYPVLLYRWANSKEEDKSGALSMWEDK